MKPDSAQTQEFSFGGISVTTSKKLVSKIIDDPLLKEKTTISSRGNILFLLDVRPSSSELKALSIFIEHCLPAFNYKILLGSMMSATEEDMKKEGFAKFFKKNGVNIEKYSYPEQVVVPLGRALFAITRSADIYTSCFYDYVFNPTHFYSSRINSEVFPIDGLDRIFKPLRTGGYAPQDSFRRNFAELQFKRINLDYERFCYPKRIPSVSIRILETKEDVSSLWKEYSEPCKVAWDLETDSLDFVDGHVGCISLAFNPREGYCIPLELVDLEELNNFFSNKIQIGQNLKFDDKFSRRELFRSRHFKIGLRPLFSADEDTLILAQVLNENRSNGLKALAYYYSPFGGYDNELDEYIETYHPQSYLEIPFPILSKYATMDSIVAFWVWEKMQKQLSELDEKFPPSYEGAFSFREYYEKIRMPSYRSFIVIEERGVYVDKDKWDTNSTIVQERILALQSQLYEELKVPEFINKGLKLAQLDFSDLTDLFDDASDEAEDKNLTSNKKLGELLKWNQWPNLGEAKLGGYLTGDEQLTQWEKKGFKAAATLKQLRSFRTLQKTFIGQINEPSGWRNHLKYHAEDNSYRIHPTYRVMGAESGRNTCDSPNWQQIPARGEIAHYVKEFISVPDKEKYFLATLDYSSLQIRLAAIDSEDRRLAGAYREDPNADMHSITGYSVFAQGKTFEIEEVVVEVDGVEKVFLAHENVKIKREDEFKTVEARDLRETDILV